MDYHRIIGGDRIKNLLVKPAHEITFNNSNSRCGGLSNISVPESKTSHLMRKILDERGAHKSILEVYNNYILDKLPRKIESSLIEVNDILYAKIENVRFQKPVKLNHGKDIDDMTTVMAKMENNYYYSVIYGDIVQYNNKDERVFVEEDITIGIIPVMVGSVLCHSYGLSDGEKEQIGLCPANPVGYFISSSDRVFKSKEILRHNVFESYKIGNEVETRLTLANNIQSTTTLLLLKYFGSGQYANKIMLWLPHFGQDKTKMINIFSCFKILGWTSEQAYEEIMKYCNCKKEQRNQIDQLISSSKSISDVNPLTDIMENVIENNSSKLDMERYDPKTVFLNELFPLQKDVDMKLKTLSFMIAHTIMIIKGYFYEDDRNSWSNKQLQTATGYIEMGFNSAWMTQMKSIKTYYEKNCKDYNTPTTTLKNRFNLQDFKKSIITKTFSTDPKNMSKSDKTPSNEHYKEMTPIDGLSSILRTNAATSTQNKRRESRMVHPSQPYIMCPAETPESEKIGIIKNMAISLHLSVSKDSPTKREIEKELKYKLLDSQTPFDDMSNREIYPLIVNGILYGHLHKDNFPKLRDMKGKKLPYDACVFFNKIHGCIEIHTYGSRPTVPFLKVGENGTLVIDEKSMWNESLEKLIEEGCLEYLDAREMEYERIAPSIDNIYELLSNNINAFNRYGYSSIQANAMLSCGTSTSPWVNRSKGPRIVYQASMVKQSMCAKSIIAHLDFSTIKKLHKGQRAICETNTCRSYGLEIMPNSTTVIVAVMPRPNNNEDAIEVKKEFLEEQFLRITKYNLIKESIAQKTHKFERPKGVDGDHRYDNIAENGMPKLNSKIEKKEFIFGKVSIGSLPEDTKNESYIAGIDDDGFVDRIFVTKSDNDKLTAHIKLSQHRHYERGDKGAFRYSQKGTIGEVKSEVDMPRIYGGPYHGVVPDIIFSPLSLPTRMTAAMPLEMVKGLEFLCNGERVDATSFEKCDIIAHKEILKERGKKFGLTGEFLENWSRGLQYMEDADGTLMGINKYDKDGNVKFIPSTVSIAPVAYQALKHHVSDKFQVRRTGPINLLTRQGISGRARYGALRFGEMEKDSFASAGAADSLLERMKHVADEYTYTVCSCGEDVIVSPQSSKVYCTGNPEHGITDKTHEFYSMKLTYICILIKKLMAIAGLKINYIPMRK